MVKKSFLFGSLFTILFSSIAQASNVPMSPINTTPTKTSTTTQYNYYNPYYLNNQFIHYNTSRCYFNNCLYTTTLTSSELREISDARRKARLKAKCKVNRAKKSKCEQLMEEEE